MKPTLPGWIENEVPGYVNGHAECRRAGLLVPDRVYATESLYGNWGGGILLLAKDLGESEILTDRIARGDKDPYRHLEGMRTNEKLVEIVSTVEQQTGVEMNRIGLLYGSALANLWRDSGPRTGPPPNKAQALTHGAAVLQFVIANMPNLRWIVCMSDVAWQCAAMVMEETAVQLTVARREYVAHRDNAQPKKAQTGIELVATLHPAAIVSLETALPPWTALARSTSANS